MLSDLGEKDAAAPTVLDRGALLDEARARAGLEDYGSPWFLQPMQVYLDALRAEARLSPAGVTVICEIILKGLVSRLRMVDDVKRHPEILDERVEVAGIVLGLPRTGSTIFHRLLASAPGMTAVRWWETQFYAPFPGEERGKPVARRAAAQAMLDQMLDAIPDLLSIHPMDIDGPDEDVMLLGQFFMSTMLEGTSYVPSFARWMNGADQLPAYRDLRVVFQYLQWQDRARRGCKWVLKAPTHLSALGAAAETFPDALFIMTHRDPVQTVPSYVSMMVALYGMVSDSVDKAEVGRYWSDRLTYLLRNFVEARDRMGNDRFIDVRYEDVVRRPIDEAERVMARMGIAVTPEMEAAMSEFLAGNKREQRAPHHYSAEAFGLSEAQLAKDFAFYRECYP